MLPQSQAVTPSGQFEQIRKSEVLDRCSSTSSIRLAMNALLQQRRRILCLRAVMAAVVFLAAWAAASVVFFAGMWTLVIGDQESEWYRLPPILGVVVVGGAAILFQRISKTGLWRAFAPTLIGIGAGFLAELWLVGILDKYF